MIGITEEVIDLLALRAAVDHPSCGATVLMSGQVRDQHEQRPVQRIEYHAYRAMAEEVIQEVVAGVISASDGVRVVACHRLGPLEVGEVSVAVAAAAPHRGDAFDACRACIDALKARLPVWKKEFGPTGEVWQEETTLGVGGEHPDEE